MEKQTNKFAIIKLGNSQYKVREGDEFVVNLVKNAKPEAEILLISDDENIKIGKPSLTSSKIDLKVLQEQKKGKKLQVQKYKAKSRYRKKIGFRPLLTVLRVEKIS